MVSVILFGSVTTGESSETVSDVDLIFILRDDASPEDRQRLLHEVTSLEILSGFGESLARRATALEAFFEKVTVNHRSIFVCKRRDLLSGSVTRILNVSPAQAAFVDRIRYSQYSFVCNDGLGRELACGRLRGAHPAL